MGEERKRGKLLSMLIFLFALTFIAGIMFGYMCFHKSPKDYTYQVKINNSRYVLKFKTIKTEIWDDCNGIGDIRHTHVELEEVKR